MVDPGAILNPAMALHSSKGACRTQYGTNSVKSDVVRRLFFSRIAGDYHSIHMLGNCGDVFLSADSKIVRSLLLFKIAARV